MKKINFKLILILFLLQIPIAKGFFDITNLFSSKSIEISFPTDIEAKNKQLSELEKYLDDFKKIYTEWNIITVKKLNDIELALTKAQKELKSSLKSEITNINIQISILNQRKQNLIKIQEILKETDTIINSHIKLVKEIIDNLKDKTPYQEPKSLYTWQEFKQAQTRVSDLQNNLETEKNKREDSIKQKTIIKETLLATQKDKNLLEEERKKFLNKQTNISQIQETNIELEANILDQKIFLTDEKTDLLTLTLEKIDREIKFRETTIENIKYLADQAQKELNITEKRLVINEQDVKNSKIELDNKQQEFELKKDSLEKIRIQRKNEQEKLIPELEKAKEHVKKIKSIGETANKYLTEIQEQKLDQQNILLDKTIKLLDTEIERRESFVKTKQIEYEIINAYHKISFDKETAITWLNNFKNQKESVNSTIKSIKDKQKEAQNISIEVSRNQDSFKALEEKIKSKKDTVFRGSPFYIEVLKNITLTKKIVGQQSRKNQQLLAVLSELLTQQEKHLNQYDFVIKDLESKYVTFSIWKRSPKAISFDELTKAYIDAENFFKKLFWDTPKWLGPTNILKALEKFNAYTYLSLFLFMLLFTTLFIILKILLRSLKTKLKIKIEHEQAQQIYKTFPLVLSSFINFISQNFTPLFSWTFLYLHVLFDFKNIFSFLNPLVNTFSVTIFYLISIPILLFIFNKLVQEIKVLNQKLNSALFTEKSQYKFTLLVTAFLYSTAILLPFKQAFLEYVSTPSELPNVIFAAYSLILLVVILLFFWKEDVLALIPSEQRFFIWLKDKINRFYYPVFIFIMSLFILANPYIGYSNLSWYLAFAIPVSAAILLGMFFVHYYLRKYSMMFFLEEEEEEIKDKFEHAKTYYGFFIISTFCILLFFTIILISKIWGLDYTPTVLWKTLSQDWVIPLGPDSKLGIVQLIILIIFVASGFFISSVAHKFILNKLFEIFKTESGTQNTITRIFHYIIIGLSIILGFVTIQLSQFVFWISGLLALGVGLGLKDMITDFVAGFFVLIERPIEIGNFIEVDERTFGTVHKISARSTTLRTANNSSIIIPNKDLVSKPIVNVGIGRLAIGFELNIIVDYDSDPELVKKLLLETIQKHPLILKIPGVIVRLEDFEDSGIKFLARAFISSRRVRDRREVASDLRIAIIKIFKENNITLAFPQQVIHFAQDETAKTFKKALDINFDPEEK